MFLAAGHNGRHPKNWLSGIPLYSPLYSQGRFLHRARCGSRVRLPWYEFNVGLYSRVADLDVPFLGYCEDSAVSQVLVCPVFMDQLLRTVLVNCPWSREVRSKRFRTRQTADTSGRVFLLLQFQFFQELPGGGSVWRAAQMIRDPWQAPPWHRWSKARWSAWRGVWVWDPSAKGMPLGLGAATAPLDGTDCAPIPLCGKGGGAHIHTHTPVHPERAAPTSTCHSRHALMSGARTCGVVLCVGM